MTDLNKSYKSYPNMAQVELADRFLICKWYRHLPSPSNPDQEKVMNRICEKYKELGGFTPDISKQVGW